MYVQDLFAEHRQDELFSLIGKPPLGTLVTIRASGIEVDHLPCSTHPEIGPQGTIRCQVARGNPLWRAVLENNNVMIVFQGPSACCSDLPKNRPRQRARLPQ